MRNCATCTSFFVVDDSFTIRTSSGTDALHRSDANFEWQILLLGNFDWNHLNNGHKFEQNRRWVIALDCLWRPDIWFDFCGFIARNQQKCCTIQILLFSLSIFIISTQESHVVGHIITYHSNAVTHPNAQNVHSVRSQAHFSCIRQSTKHTITVDKNGLDLWPFVGR